MTTEELARETKADPALMKRVLRNLAALSHIDEVDDDVFMANKFSKAFTLPKGVGGAKFSYVTYLDIAMAWPCTFVAAFVFALMVCIVDVKVVYEFACNVFASLQDISHRSC